jgi:hypothetical protein
MTHTRSWQVVVSGNRPRNQMDDAQREIRVDVQERMQDLLQPTGDWTADPVDAGTTSFRLFMHWSAFKNFLRLFGDKTGYDTLYNQGIRGTTGTTLVFTGQLRLPKGSVLTDVDVSCVTVVNTSITTVVYKVDASTSTPTRTTLATRALSGVNAQGNYSVSSGAGINSTVASTEDLYFVEVTMVNSTAGSANYGFHGITAKYTRGVLKYV